MRGTVDFVFTPAAPCTTSPGERARAVSGESSARVYFGKAVRAQVKWAHSPRGTDADVAREMESLRGECGGFRAEQGAGRCKLCLSPCFCIIFD